MRERADDGVADARTARARTGDRADHRSHESRLFVRGRHTERRGASARAKRGQGGAERERRAKGDGGGE